MSKLLQVRRRALIADDDPTIRKVMRAALARDGFDVTEAADGAEAVEAFVADEPDLVLLDVDMPGYDGFHACEQIRATPTGEHVPIVMATGREDVEAVNDAYRAGATDFIAKPINWPVFGHRMRYVLRTALNSAELRKSEAKNEALLRAMPDTLFVLSPGGRIVDFMAGSGEHGLPAPGEEQSTLFDYLPEKAAGTWYVMKQAVERTGEPRSREFTLAGDDGAMRHYEARFMPYLDRQTLVLVSEITERKLTEDRIHRLAYFDTLTGLPNRMSFQQHLEQMVEHARLRNGKVALLYVDLDNFKRINDTLGHTYGDGVLQAIAERLTGCVRTQSGNTADPVGPLDIARLGGDEFEIALQDIDEDGVVSVVAQRIGDRLRQPVRYREQEFVVTPSIGIAIFPDDSDNVEDLFKHADVAMYQAKNAGRDSVRRYTGTMSLRSLQRLELEGRLRSALEQDLLELHYQPKLDLRGDRIVGVEALVRWPDPERGYIPPVQFIPMAEESGLIVPLGEWVLNTACRQARRWQKRIPGGVQVAVNISSQQFYQSNLQRTVMQALFEASVKPSLIQLELTESILMRDVSATIATLEHLKSIGLTIAIDDFGTGYSSLSYLKRFPFDAIKIDRSFVKDLEANNDDAAICAAIIAMAHRLGLLVIAEGVETEEQVHYLREQGCEQIQGYLLSKPLPAKDIEALLLDGALQLPEAAAAR